MPADNTESFEPLTEGLWAECLDAYVDAWKRCSTHNKRNDSPGDALFPLVNSLLVELVAYSGMRIDKDAEYLRYKNFYPGIHLAYKSGPISANIQFGIYANDWFVETPLTYFDSIPNVTEDFWTRISAVCRLAKTTFEDDPSIPNDSPEHKRLLRSGRSIHYKIARSFVLLRSQPETQPTYPSRSDIGMLRSEVSISSSFNECTDTLRQLYRHYYRCLYELYRYEHQKSRRARIAELKALEKRYQ